MGAANVGPLAEVGFAEDYCARFAQLGGHKRVFLRSRAEQGKRSGSGVHAVSSVDVVFDEDWNSVERAAWTFVFAFPVERFSDFQCFGIHLDDAVDPGAGFVDVLNAGEIFFGKAAGRIFSGLHRLLEIVNGEFVEFEFAGDHIGIRRLIVRAVQP